MRVSTCSARSLALGLAIAIVSLTQPGLGGRADAAQGDCGQPLSAGAGPSSVDCLFILQAAIGTQTCTPGCICDVTGRDGVSAADALACLQVAIGTESVTLDCPCDVTTTTTTTLPASFGVEASLSGEAEPGAALEAIAEISLPAGCEIETIQWSQTSGPLATIQQADSADATIVLASASEYRASLIEKLSEPPISAAQLPPNVPLPEGEFPGGLPDRFQVVGVNPFALEEAGAATFQVSVTASCGSATDSVSLHTELPWTTASGLRNVPIGRPVILQGRAHVDEDEDGLNDVTAAPTTYDWSLSATPPGSNATLSDPTTQTPEFTPDVTGHYTLTVTDTTRAPGDAVVTFEIYAGTWSGVITGQDDEGLPLAANCTGCHNGDLAPDQFSTWRTTGHAEIFTSQINTSSYWGEQCFACHTVGFDKGADNGGVDDAPDYEDFLTSGLIGHPSPDNWTLTLENYAATARLANVQCENCHGPQSGAGSHTLGAPRVGLSSDVCATCHGEPLRHARFQQWQLSAHANYDLAVEEGGSGNCSRCHTANGFLAWLPILLDDDPATDPVNDITVTWAIDEVHPQTCATCHDPHDNGNVSGTDTNARVRISGNTPPLIGGFTALGVGKGAMCMTCHNSRRGLRNDSVWSQYVGTSEASRAPHGSVQADLLMGQNAYLVNTGIRGNHSFVADTCVNCHMQRTPPPDDLAYNQQGTNHTFYASDQICSQCHGSAFDARGVQEAFQATFDALEEMVVEGYLALFADEIALGNAIVLELGGGVERVITDVSEIAELTLGEARGGLGLAFVFSDSTEVSPLAFASIEVRDGTNTAVCAPGLATCELYVVADDVLLKTSWNWAYLHSDGSQGIHNPSFALQVLDASIDALDAAGP
jgi:hypothetical protein